ncbi:MAG: hypothetical protein RL748_4279 [Pseudomonadota bacterium]
MRRISVGRLMSEAATEGSVTGAGRMRSDATPGAQLANAREVLGWSVEQVAEQLKLAPRQVLALEAGDYQVLPGLATVRGFVRAYAKLVKLDAAPLVAMIGDNDVPVSTLPPVRRDLAMPFSEVRLPSMRRRGMSAASWAVLGAVCLVLAVGVAAKMGWLKPLPADLLKQGSAQAVSSSTSAVSVASAPALASATNATNPGNPATDAFTTPAPVVLSGINETTPVPAAQDNASATPDPALAAPVSSPTPAPLVTPTPLVTPVAQPPVAASSNALVLKFRQDCWVEVKKVNGNVLLSRLMKAGESETIAMTDPVQLVLGNNLGVEASLRGAPLNLRTGPTNTTRLIVK